MAVHSPRPDRAASAPTLSPIPELFSDVPEPFRDAYDAGAPWLLLGDPLERLFGGLPSGRIETSLSPDVHLSGDRIVIGRGARIAPGATLEGPLAIGDDVEIRPGAYIRGGCWIGDGAIVGASTEVKHSILFPGARAPHLNYVGDSILGHDVNLGAGTILSNFRHDGADIELPHPEKEGERIATGLRKLGAVLGDGVLTGCNDVFNPGVVLGRESMVYTGVQLRAGIYPARSIVKLRQEIEVVAKR